MNTFRRVAQRTSYILGTPRAFYIAAAFLVLWGATGPYFQYSAMWQFIIQAVPTAFSLLTVILIQNTQNRDSEAMHLKLDELLRSIKEARTELVEVEDLPDGEMEKLKEEFVEIAEAEKEIKKTVQGARGGKTKIPIKITKIKKTNL